MYVQTLVFSVLMPGLSEIAMAMFVGAFEDAMEERKKLFVVQVSSCVDRMVFG